MRLREVLQEPKSNEENLRGNLLLFEPKRKPSSYFPCIEQQDNSNNSLNDKSKQESNPSLKIEEEVPDNLMISHESSRSISAVSSFQAEEDKQREQEEA